LEDTRLLKRRIADLLDSQRLAVLATHGQGQPHGSLVSFACTADLRQMLFATPRSTRKYANLLENPRVALVVDSREKAERDLHLAEALTVTGTALEAAPEEAGAWLRLYLGKHPHLEDFAVAPTCARFKVLVETYSLVQRFQEVTKLHVGSWD